MASPMVAMVAATGCVPAINSTTPESPSTSNDASDPASEGGEVAIQASSTSARPDAAGSGTSSQTTASTSSASTSASTTSTTSTTVRSTTTPTAARGGADDQRPAEEATGYAEWDSFWTTFSQAATVGDPATVGTLTADELTLVYAGGSVTTWTGSKDEIIANFDRPNEVFDPNRQILDDGTAFTAALGPSGRSGVFDDFGVNQLMS